MFVKIKNLKVHYKIAGCGQFLVLIHGWGGDLGYFAEMKDHLAKNFTVYMLDLPGFGLSDRPNEVWGSFEYADFVRKFIKQMKIIDPILLGHSLGGKIVARLVADNLVKAKKIVLISSSGVKLPRRFKVMVRVYFFKMLKFLGSLPIIRELVKLKIEIYRKRFGSSDYRNASGIMRSIMVKVVNEDIVSILPKIKVPALLLWGERDNDTPLRAGRIMEQAILNAKLKVISNGGHFPFLDNWEEVKKELDNFLS